jgi:hypothetical protein
MTWRMCSTRTSYSTTRFRTTEDGLEILSTESTGPWSILFNRGRRPPSLIHGCCVRPHGGWHNERTQDLPDMRGVLPTASPSTLPKDGHAAKTHCQRTWCNGMPKPRLPKFPPRPLYQNKRRERGNEHRHGRSPPSQLRATALLTQCLD